MQLLIYRYYDHPLTAVTSAMLVGSSHTSESESEQQQQQQPSSIITTTNMNNNIQITNSHQLHQIHNSNGTYYVYENYKVPDKDIIQWR